MLREHERRVLGREGRAARDELVERDAERVEIAGGTGLLAADLLGRHVADGADDDALGRQPAGVGEVGDAEVAERGGAVGGEPHVVGLDVAVHDAVLVRVGEAGGELAADPGHVGDAGEWRASMSASEPPRIARSTR